MDLKGIESNGHLKLLGLHYVYWGTSQVPRLRQARAGRPLPICDLPQFFPSHDGGIKSTFDRGLEGEMRNGELAVLVVHQPRPLTATWDFYHVALYVLS